MSTKIVAYLLFCVNSLNPSAQPREIKITEYEFEQIESTLDLDQSGIAYRRALINSCSAHGVAASLAWLSVKNLSASRG